MTKQRFSFTLIVAAVVLSTGKATAALILYEPFEYDPAQGLAGMDGQAGAAERSDVRHDRRGSVQHVAQ